MNIVNEKTAKYVGKKSVALGLGILETKGEYLVFVTMSSTNTSQSKCSIYDAVTRDIEDKSVELISSSFSRNLASAIYKVTIDEDRTSRPFSNGVQLIFEGRAPMASVGDAYGIVIKL